MLSHSFDRFYVVAKFELPRVEDLKLTTIEFDSKCTYLSRNDTQKNSYFPTHLAYCLKIVPYVEFYKKQIEYYNLIVQFPVFVQPYTQRSLVMYQIETVPIPILDQNDQAQSCTQLKIRKPYIALNTENYITL